MQLLERMLTIKYIVGLGFVGSLIAYGCGGHPEFWRSAWFFAVAYFFCSEQHQF